MRRLDGVAVSLGSLRERLHVRDVRRRDSDRERLRRRQHLHRERLRGHPDHVRVGSMQHPRLQRDANVHRHSAERDTVQRRECLYLERHLRCGRVRQWSTGPAPDQCVPSEQCLQPVIGTCDPLTGQLQQAQQVGRRAVRRRKPVHAPRQLPGGRVHRRRRDRLSVSRRGEHVRSCDGPTQQRREGELPRGAVRPHYPPYWLVLPLAGGYWLWDPETAQHLGLGPITLTDFGRALVLYDQHFQTFMPVTWTLMYEWMFYLVFAVTYVAVKPWAWFATATAWLVAIVGAPHD
jgi:hypothetical protein